MPARARPLPSALLALGIVAAAAPGAAAPAQPASGAPTPVLPAQDLRADAEQGWDAATRRAVQEALVWTGDYDSRIDGAIGPRTRQAIRDFQRRQGYPATGQLRRGEVEALMAEADAAKRAAGFRVVEDAETGIRIGLPLGLVSRSHRDGQTVVYRPPGGEGIVSLALISMPGGRSELDGLFRVLTDPDVVEPDAYTLLKDSYLVVSDEKGGTVTYTYVASAGGALKGFTLGWPERRSETFDPIAVMMFNTFEPIPGVLD